MIQVNPTAPMPTTTSTTQENPSPTHNNTAIDRVVEKQDPINDEIPMRTRATLAANRGAVLATSNDPA